MKGSPSVTHDIAEASISEKSVRLGDICEIQLGKMLSPASKRGASPKPYLRNANVQWGRFALGDVATMDFSAEEREKFLLRPGDLLVCEGGEPGRSAVWQGQIEPCYYQKALHRIRPKNGRVDPEYLMYRLWYASVIGEFDDSHRKSTIAHLPLERLRELRIDLPSIHHQRRIAERVAVAFRHADRARAAADDQLETAEQLVERVIACAFGESTPVLAGTRTSVSTGGWTWHVLTDLAALESGHTPSRRRPDWWGGDVRWIALPDIRALDGRIAFETAEHVNEQGIANSSARVLPAGTVVMSRTASVGFVTLMGRPMATSQDFVNWVCGPDLDPRFLAYALRASREYVRGLSSGAVHKTVYMPTLKSFHICAPALAEQRRIVAQLDSQLADASRMASGLAARRDAIALLPTAILRSAFAAKESVELRRGAVASFLVHRLHAQPTFGRVMFQKLLYLAEAHVGTELGGQYQRHAAGPHAPKGLREIERIATEKAWFTVRREEGRYTYEPGPNIEDRLRAAKELLGDRTGELDRLVNIFGPRRTEYAEVVATLFAAWNDLMMDGRGASPDEIITEVHSNWHERKLRFGAERLRRALRWMRDNNIVPTGRGPRTEMVNA